MPPKKSTAASNSTSKPLRSKLGTINDDMEDIVEQAKVLEQNQKHEKDLQTLCESFIKGQGTIYVLEVGNKVQTDDGIQDNDPEYLEHAWNPRTIGKSAVTKFLSSSGGIHRIFPKSQEYAITIAVSPSLLNTNTLATYQSHEFPNINFKVHNNSNIYIFNGHHRIAGWKVVHQQLLSQLHTYEHLLKGGFSVASDNDTPEIIEARTNVGELKEQLFKEGGWGAVVLDYDAIVSHSRAEEIKAFWARNLGHFHVPDSAQDMLQMILRAVRSMPPQRGFDFLESQLNRSDKVDQNKLRPLIKNPRLLFIFSELMTLPMFEDIKLVNFHKLDKWRNMVPCWLNIFLNFARDSYRFVAFPTEQKLESITDVKDCGACTTQYAFGFLDTSFHDIIDDAYRTHLALVFLAFGAPDGSIKVKGEERGNWTTSFAVYRVDVLEKLTEWAQGPNRPQEYRAHFSVLVDRITYILDKACQEYPSISKLNVPIPLACNTFIQDLGQDLYKWEGPMFEFLALFEPTIAMRYGYKKKFTAPFDIFELFNNFATMPTGGISSDDDWIMNTPEIDETISEIWASLFLARYTVISAVKTLHSQRKNSWEPLKAADVKPDSQSMDVHLALGLVEVLNIWVKEQREIEVKLTKGLSKEQLSFLDGDSVNPKKYGCILLSSHYPWSAQFSSTPHQHHIGVAISTMQLHRDKGVYQQYLGEDIVWALFSKILGLLHKIAPSFQPWHGVSQEEDRVRNQTQVILQQSLCKQSIGTLLGATMAQSTSAINERYRAGLKQITKVVEDIAVYNHDGQKYISYDVITKLEEFYQTLAKECVHQAFQFEQHKNYLPPEQINRSELDHILKSRLDISFPLPNIEVMSQLQRCSFGNQAIEQEQRKQEIKAQKVIDDKAKKRASKRNTVAEDEAIEHFDPSGSTQKRARVAEDEAIEHFGPSGSTQKHPRVLSSESVSPKKRGKHHGTNSSSDEVMGNAYVGKGKEKEQVWAPDSGEDHDMDQEDAANTGSSDSPPAQSP
ncbi:hypothetical protein BYT27DRAFT_7214906 [Phlegmacium glaucopus]|nr:hypothetical protein BYT27DRAFT_7214906 [Phlegmacium glaucopus]